MKNVLLIAALTLASAPAFASKARLGALQNGMTTATDIQQVFEAPSKMWDLADQATFEFGPTGTTYSAAGAATNNGSTIAAPGASTAEGGFLRSHGDSKWGAYLGHQSESLVYMLLGGQGGVMGTATTKASLKRLENPLNLWYGFKAGDLKYGVNLFYANSERKTGTDPSKKTAYGASFGAQADTWNANLVVGLGAKLEDKTTGANETFTGQTSFKLMGEMVVNDNLLAYGSATMFGGKRENNAGTEVGKLDHQDFAVGVESKIKSDIAHFYYGAKIVNGTEKNGVTGAAVEKIEVTQLPVYFGLEADAASWLVLRASLTQNVLLNSVKASTAANSDANDVDTTVAALGAGLKFGKLMVDGLMSAGTTGKLNFNNGSTIANDSGNFMTQASLTYNF